jgi:hypothetical protein
MITVPAPCPVSTPLPETLTTAGFDELHVAATSGNDAPSESVYVAASVAVPPMPSVVSAGATVTTGAEVVRAVTTVIVAVPLRTPTVAVIVAEPVATPVIVPSVATETMAAFELVHKAGVPVMGAPSVSVRDATSARLPPMPIRTSLGRIRTVATFLAAAL